MVAIGARWHLENGKGNGKEEESEGPGGKGGKEESWTTKTQGRHQKGDKETFISRGFEAGPLLTCTIG